MKRATNTLLLITGMIVFFAGAAMQNSGLMGAGATTFLVAVFIDYRRAQKCKAERQIAVEKRIRNLTSKKWQEGNSLAVPSGTAFFLVVAIPIAIGSAYVAYFSLVQTPRNWPYAAISLLVFLISAVAVPRICSGIGKNALTLDARGLSTPIFGFIPWKYVLGLHLQTYNFRGQIIYTLIFRLSLPPNERFDFHWTESLLSLIGLGALRRGVIAVQLKDQSGDDYPESIAAAAKHLWTQATGASHDWNPNLSEEYNAAAKRLSETLATKRSRELGDPSAARYPGEVRHTEARRVIEDANIMHREQAKQIKRLHWVIVVATIGVFISLVWPIVKPYLR